RKSDVGDSTVLIERLNVNGNTNTTQLFAQWNYKLSPKLTTNLGLHYFHVFLNSSKSLEPRASIKYELTPKNILSVGYGLHSQLQPIGLYFSRKPISDNAFILPNKNLELSKAHHVVIGFDRIVNEFSHIKTEFYYQHLYDIPVSTDKNSTYSILNAMDGFTDESLVN